MQNLSEGSTLQNGKYRIISVLGQGGFGITYLAEHTMLDTKVAIKEFFPKDFCNRDSITSQVSVGAVNTAELVGKLKDKFLKEAKNIAKLNHPNIITIHDIFEENNTAYYIMSFVEGQSLGDIIKKAGALSEERALKYIREVCDAIGYMHSKSMNHLDIKPANIMIRESDDKPIIIDFGTSKQYDNEGEQTSTMAPGFTHGYAPIEQYKPGGVSTFTPQTDIYAIGATLYALLTGEKPPHYSEILEDGLPELPHNISPETVDAIKRSMSISKIKRQSTIMEFTSELASSNSDNCEDIITPNSKFNLTSYGSEETVLSILDEDDGIDESINTPDISTDLMNHSMPKREVKIDNIEFIDLGLSVKWANMNVGAASTLDNGDYYTSDGKLHIVDYSARPINIPTEAEFEELIIKCSLEWVNCGKRQALKAIGPNGRSIVIPCCGLSESSQTPFYGVYWTKEAFENKNSSFFYISRNEVKNTNYRIKMDCPIRLVQK